MDRVIKRLPVNYLKLLEKQQNAQETAHHWLYSYLTLRIHFNLLVIYGAFMMSYSLISCETNASMKNKIYEKICLFNYTYVVSVGQKTTMFSGLQPIDQPRNYVHQKYYPHMFVVLFGQYVINLAVNSINYKMKCYKIKSLVGSQLMCQYKGLHNRNKFIKCLMKKLRKQINCNTLKLQWAVFFLTENFILLGLGIKFALLNLIFNQQFLFYGIRVVQYYVLGQTTQDPIRQCSFKLYGSSGSIQTYDSVCVLLFNYLNQFIYTFFWFWYFMLFVLVAGMLLFKLALLASPFLRARVFEHSFHINQNNPERKPGRIDFGNYLLVLSISDVVGRAVTVRIMRQNSFLLDFNQTENNCPIDSSVVNIKVTT